MGVENLGCRTWFLWVRPGCSLAGRKKGSCFCNGVPTTDRKTSGQGHRGVHVALLVLAIGFEAPWCLSFPIYNSFHKYLPKVCHCPARAHKVTQGGLQDFAHAVENSCLSHLFSCWVLSSSQSWLRQVLLGQAPSSEWFIPHWLPSVWGQWWWRGRWWLNFPTKP